MVEKRHEEGKEMIYISLQNGMAEGMERLLRGLKLSIFALTFHL